MFSARGAQGLLLGKSSLAVISPTDPLLIAARLLSSLHRSAGGREEGGRVEGWRRKKGNKKRGVHVEK